MRFVRFVGNRSCPDLAPAMSGGRFTIPPSWQDFSTVCSRGVARFPKGMSMNMKPFDGMETMLAGMVAETGEWKRAAGGSITEVAAGWIAPHYLVAVRGRLAVLPEGAERFALLRLAVGDAVALQRGGQSRRRKRRGPGRLRKDGAQHPRLRAGLWGGNIQRKIMAALKNLGEGTGTVRQPAGEDACPTGEKGFGYIPSWVAVATRCGWSGRTQPRSGNLSGLIRVNPG